MPKWRKTAVMFCSVASRIEFSTTPINFSRQKVSSALHVKLCNGLRGVGLYDTEKVLYGVKLTTMVEMGVDGMAADGLHSQENPQYMHGVVHYEL